MAERRLTTRELNRALLARQGLLERAPTPLPRMLERMGGLQAQYAPSMYVGLWTRVEGLARDDVTRALERRSAVQATLMRITIHLVSRADYWPIALAVRQGRRASYLRGARAEARERGPPAERVRAALAGAPRSRAELEAAAGGPRAIAVGLW